MGPSISLLAVTAMVMAACNGQVSPETPPKGATEQPATNDGGVSADGTANLSVPRCVPGQSVACACVNGQMGAQVCQADGTYGPCVCSSSHVDVDSSVVSDASFGDVAQDRSSGGVNIDGAIVGDSSVVSDASIGDVAQDGSVNLLGADGATCAVATVCALPGQVEAPASSQQELTDRLVGQWVVCGTTSVFGTNEWGMEIVSDGNWYKLNVSGGAVVRGQGFDGQGTWTIVGTSSPFQLNLYLSGGTSFIPLLPAFTTNPRKMRLDNSGNVVDYAFATCP